MKTDTYACAACVLVNSIRKHFDTEVLKCVDFVAFTNGLSAEAVKLLESTMDHVVSVELLEFDVNLDIWPRFKDNYGWLRACFTKLYTFKLTQYEKCLFMDSDMLCLGDFSKIFELPAPAGCLISNLKEGYQTGAILTPLDTLLALRDGYGIAGAFWMVKPSEQEFQRAV